MKTKKMGSKPKESHNKAVEEFAYPVTPPEPIPLIQLFLYPELLDALKQIDERLQSAIRDGDTTRIVRAREISSTALAKLSRLT